MLHDVEQHASRVGIWAKSMDASDSMDASGSGSWRLFFDKLNPSSLLAPVDVTENPDGRVGPWIS